MKESPEPPQNFPERIIIAVTRRSCPVPAFLRSCVAAGIRRGTLERVPRTPQNFPERIIAAVTQRSRPVLRASPYRTLPSLPPPVPLPAQPRGCKGRSPLHKKTMILPLPRRGRGSGGDGGRKNSKGRVDRQPPGQTPAGVSLPPSCIQRRAGTAAGGAGGEAPGKTNLLSPPYPEGKGVGGIGAKSL